MKKLITLFVISVLFFSCSNEKDGQFCKCLEAGEKLNSFSVGMLQETITAKEADSLKKLKAAKKEACANYQTMKGDEMLKRKKECVN